LLYLQHMKHIGKFMYIRVLAYSRRDFEITCNFWKINQYVDAKYVMNTIGLRGQSSPIIMLPDWESNINIDVYGIREYLQYAKERNIEIIKLSDDDQLPEHLRK